MDKIRTRHPVTVTADTPIDEARHLMLAKKIAGLPVLASGRVIGIITEADMFRIVVKAWNEAAA